MQLKLDVKTFVVGILLGAAIAAAIGANIGGADAGLRRSLPLPGPVAATGANIGGADAARFGISIEKDGSALVQTSDGGFFIVNPKSAVAVRVLEATSLKAEPADNRDSKGRPFGLGGSDKQRKTSTPGN